MSSLLPSAFYIFSQGVLLSWGPCVLFCSAYILPLSLFSAVNKRESIINFVYFMLGKVLTYIFLGLGAGLIGAWVLSDSFSLFFRWLFLLLLTGFGIHLVFFKAEQSCFLKKLVKKNFFVVGITIGLAPCFPLVGILLQIGLQAQTLAEALILSIAFSLGTLFTPVWLLLWGFSELKEKFIHQTIGNYLRKVVGVMIILFVIFNITFLKISF